MSLFSRIERRAAASVAGSWDKWTAEVEALPVSASGARVSPERARTLSAVWACQSLIADSIAALPVDTFRRVGDRRSPTKPPAWLKTPNPFETPYAFWHRVMVSLIGQDGNAFILTMRNEAGAVVSVWVLDPREVDIDEESPTPLYRYRGQEFTAREILHIPAFVVPGCRRSLSVIDHAREAIGLGLAAEEFGARFFSQGVTLSGIVEHPGNPKPGEVAVLAAMLRKRHAGVRNSHAVGILTGGAKWQSISITPEQAQFLETRRFQNIEIAKLYRVPPHLIDPSVQSSWGSGVEEQNRFFVDFTLVPWLTRLEQAFSTLLPNGQYLKFNTGALLRANTAERYAAYATLVNNGIANLNEVRALEDWSPLPDGLGERFRVPANLTELTATDPVAEGEDDDNGDGAPDTPE